MLVVGWMGVWKRVFIVLLVGGERAGDDAEFLVLADLILLKLLCTEHSTVDDFGGGKGILTTLESDEFGWEGGLSASMMNGSSSRGMGKVGSRVSMGPRIPCERPSAGLCSLWMYLVLMSRQLGTVRRKEWICLNTVLVAQLQWWPFFQPSTMPVLSPWTMT